MPNPPAAFSPAHVYPKAGTQHCGLLPYMAVSCSMTNSYVATRDIDLSSHLLFIPSEALLCHISAWATGPSPAAGKLERGHFPAQAINRHSRRSRLLTGTVEAPEGVKERRNPTPETHDARVRYLSIKHESIQGSFSDDTANKRTRCGRLRAAIGAETREQISREILFGVST
jgi:hypothetical protein